jgi:hypothetical protein
MFSPIWGHDEDEGGGDGIGIVMPACSGLIAEFRNGVFEKP